MVQSGVADNAGAQSNDLDNSTGRRGHVGGLRHVDANGPPRFTANNCRTGEGRTTQINDGSIDAAATIMGIHINLAAAAARESCTAEVELRRDVNGQRRRFSR